MSPKTCAEFEKYAHRVDIDMEGARGGLGGYGGGDLCGRGGRLDGEQGDPGGARNAG